MTDIRIAVVEVPDAGKSIDYAVSNKPPLLPSPIAKLPLGSIRPKGWIKHQLDLTADGQTGRLPEVSPFLCEDNGWLGNPKPGWEAEPYWLRGFHDVGVLTGDQRVLAEANRWMEGVISTQQEDGYFGPATIKRQVGDNGMVVCDLWPHMIMIDVLRAHWEATGDERIIPLLLGFFKFCAAIPDDQFLPEESDTFGGTAPFWQKIRAGDMLPHIYWLYNQTGEAWLLDVATRFHENIGKPEDECLCRHVVNFTQRFREPGNYYAQSHDMSHLRETEYWYDSHMATWGQQPGGVFGGDEVVRPGKTDAKQGIETCAIVEYCKSFYVLGQITGQALYADRVEDMIFNTFPASQLPNLKGLHYVTAANQPQLDATDDHDYANVVRLLDYSPHIYFCCQHNVSMGWPYYAEHMWMAAPGNGLAAWLYGASEVTAKVHDGVQVTIREETEYPFDTSVRMTIETQAEVAFPLYLRVPAWCEGFKVQVNGDILEIVGEPDHYVMIERTWKSGDTIDIDMPVHLSLRVWEKQGGAVTLDRGPLSYSLKIGEDWRRGSGGSDEWPEWEIFPTTPWNYGLVFDPDDIEGSFEITKTEGRTADQPWTLQAAPIEIKGKGKRIPNWQMVGHGVTDLQPSTVRSDEPTEEIKFIPMGCARLRMCCLPVIGDGPDAHEWRRVSSHEEALQLRAKMEP